MSKPDAALLDAGTASQEEQERRVERRHDVDEYSDVLLAGSGGPCRARIMDISRSGLRLRTRMPLALESEIIIYLKDMSLEARICYCRPQDESVVSG